MLATYTALDVCGVGAVLEVIPAGRSQCGLKRFDHSSSVLASPRLGSASGRGAEHRPEWLTGIDNLEELLARLYWQPACAPALPNTLCVSLCARRQRVQLYRPGTQLAPVCVIHGPALACDHAESVLIKP
jgi:hypothetical protein